MGVFNLLKLANDYNKARKALEKHGLTKEECVKYLEKVKAFTLELVTLKNELVSLIDRVKQVRDTLKEGAK